MSSKTLQRRLISLVQSGRVERSGRLKSTRYYISDNNALVEGDSDKIAVAEDIFSEAGKNDLRFLAKKKHFRDKVTYNRAFIESYKPNSTFYVPEDVRRWLHSKGRRFDVEEAAGSYVRLISPRILIDMSHFSSKLEGNTYSLLDTENLIEHGYEAEGKDFEETQMILNHRAAIVYLIENAETIDVDDLTIRSLHALLSKLLLANYSASGGVRQKPVVIRESTYVPIGNPEDLKAAFRQVLEIARGILDRFEQSFFLLIHFAYLQAFEDVNKRTSRLASNIPLFKQNLCPLSFVGVERHHYTDALLALYEKNAVQPMLDLYVWAYSRSCSEYEVVRRSLSRWSLKDRQYQAHLNEAMRYVVLDGLHGKAMENFVEGYCTKNQLLDDKAFFATVKTLLRDTHEGNVILLNVTPEQFTKWIIDEP